MINEKIQDLFLRYGFILSKRYTKKQKEQVVQALNLDLKSMRDDVKIDNFNNQGKKSQNVYVGSIKNANKIIATYYDTPAIHFGDYHPLDAKKNSKNTLLFIGISSLILFIVGVVYTIMYIQPVLTNEDLFSLKSILSIISYFIFFILLNLAIKGIPYRNTIVRNTSSVFFLLTLIYKNICGANVSYAFLDNGCKNNSGLERLKELNPNAEIIYLDSIGSRETIKKIKINHNEKFNNSLLPDGVTLFVASSAEDKNYIIEKNDLKSKKINEQNMEILFQYFEKGE